MVTDWNPLTIWFYNEVYVRFSANDYETKDLSNKYKLKKIFLLFFN